MMRITHLKHILFTQFIFIAVLPIFFISLAAVVWVFPRVLDLKEKQLIELSKTIAYKIENHLGNPRASLYGVANHIRSDLSGEADYKKMMELQVATSPSLEAIYLIKPDGKVESLALKNSNPELEKDLISLDLSKNPAFLKASKYNQPIWSDTFLSLVGGGLSVAFAVPSSGHIVMGEIDLGYLTDFLGQIAAAEDQVIMILDRKGQVIADQSGRFTAQQLNLSHIPLVRTVLDGSSGTATGYFRLSGKMMKGNLLKTPLVDWKILVARSRTEAFRPVWMGSLLLGIISITTVVSGIILSLILTARLAVPFSELTQHARQIAAGKQTGKWPEFQTSEMKSLVEDIQFMAASMKEREEYSRILFADSPVPLMVIHPDSLECLDVNQAALKLFGISSPEDICGSSILSYSFPEQSGNEEARSGLEKYFRKVSEKEIVNFEWEFYNKEKGSWNGNVALSVFHHGEKKLVQMSVIDITQVKIEEAKRKRLEKQLMQARKMESIGTLAGGIAHDFNNILFPVLGFSEMVLDDLPEESPLKPMVLQILEGGLKARDLVNQLLIFSRQDSRKYKPIQIQSAISEVLDKEGLEIPQNVEIIRDISPKGGLLMADFDHIHLIISNLVANALFAMKENGGKLSVTSGDTRILSGDLPDLNLAPGWYVCVRVSDSGPGISSEIQDKIFDPYFSTKGKGEDKGTGLGLAVVHGIVKSYEGDITVESRPGEGSVFSLYLPRYVSTGKIQADSEVLHGPGTGGRILLVDDEKIYLSMMQESLEIMGYSVSAFDDAVKALQAFCSGEFDVVITDLVMPKMRGDTLAREIKSGSPGVPVILCTGFSEQLDPESTKEKQIDAVLAKPVLRDDLAKVIQNVLKEYKPFKKTGG